MSDRPRAEPGVASRRGATTGPRGTPFPVDLSGDRRDRAALALLVAGPVIWFGHFAVVYLVAEAGCTGDGHGLDAFDPPVPEITTIVATVVAALACIVTAVLTARRWRARTAHTEADASSVVRDGTDRGGLAAAGFLLSGLSLVAVLFVGLVALALPGC